MGNSELQPVFVEIIGEPAVGKTHTSLLFSDPVLADLTARGESKSLVIKLFPEDWEQRYFRCRSYKELTAALVKAHGEGRKTFIVETGSDMRAMGGEEYLKELQKEKSNREKLHPTEWGHVNEAVSAFVSKCIEEFKMNLVFTAQMGDEWKDGKPTGRRERRGYPRMDFSADLRLYISIVEKVTETNPPKVVKYRNCLFFKNRFVDVLSADYVANITLEADSSPKEMRTFREIMKATELPEESWVK